MILVNKELDGLKDPVTSDKYPIWRNLSLVTILMTFEFEIENWQLERKRINNEKELRGQLERL
jgi:hypothetical protein